MVTTYVNSAIYSVTSSIKVIVVFSYRTFLPKNWPCYPLDLAQRHQHLPQGHPGAGLCHPPGGRCHLRRFRRSHPDRHEGCELPDQAVRAAGRIYGQVCFLLRAQRDGLRRRGLQHVHGSRQRQVRILKRIRNLPESIE